MLIILNIVSIAILIIVVVIFLEIKEMNKIIGALLQNKLSAPSLGNFFQMPTPDNKENGKEKNNSYL